MITTKILVCTHKEGYVRSDNIHMPIQVGKSISEKKLNYQGDDSGENISSKNKTYCELTAMYWAWKNLQKIDIIGLSHYRRYFNFQSISQLSAYQIEIKEKDYKLRTSNIDEIEIKKILKKYDIILPKFWSIPTSVKKDFYISVCEEDFEIFCRVIRKKYPEYMPYLEKYCLGNKRTGCNMLITRKDIFDNYCEWMFDILFEVEKHIKLSNYTYYQRIFGFLSEILLPVYCMKNKLKIKKKPIYFITNSETKPSLQLFLIRGLKNMLNTIAFKISNLRQEKLQNTTFWDNYLKSDNIKI